MVRKLTYEERMRAKTLRKENIKRNPLRRVLLNCEHGWVRDAEAMLKDWIWCDRCKDSRRVIEIAE